MIRAELLQRCARRLCIKHKDAKVSVFIEMHGQLYSVQSTPGWPFQRETVTSYPNPSAGNESSQNPQGSSHEVGNQTSDPQVQPRLSNALDVNNLCALYREELWVDDTSTPDFTTVRWIVRETSSIHTILHCWHRIQGSVNSTPIERLEEGLSFLSFLSTCWHHSG